MFLCNDCFYALTGVELVFTGQTLTNVINMEICAQFLCNYINNLITSPNFAHFLLALKAAMKYSNFSVNKISYYICT